MIDLTITDEELEALKVYKEEKYEAINQMLVSNCETDIALLSEDVENKVISIDYDRESVINYLKNIKLVYRLILKKYYSNLHMKIPTYYRGTNLSEVERIKNELFIDRFLSATEDEDDAINKYSSKWNRPACMRIKLEKDVPYILLDDLLKGKKYKKEILISPFTKLKSILEDEEKVIEKNSKPVKIYNVEIEKQSLDELTDRERNGLYNYILENAYSIKRKITECIELEKENTANFENIRKLEQLLAKYENSIEEKEATKEYSDREREVDYDDISRISKELEEIKNASTDLFEIRKEHINFVNMWKRNIAVYMIAECREIEKEFESIKKSLEEDKELNENELEDKIENVKQQNNVNQQNLDNQETKVINIVNDNLKLEENNQSEDEEKNPIVSRVKNECRENIEAGEKLLEDINDLITKQQNHAKIAGNMGASYSALNNAFEMRKVATNLLELLRNINLKVNAVCETSDFEEKLEKISKSNIEISTLINYLNNPKIAARNSKATRFDEMAIIEENELKKGISEKIRDIRGEAELKKLKDDLEIIEDKGKISKFFGIFTGQNKLDDFMIEQIEIRQKAIRKTLSRKLSLAYNYSIHELMAEITMFVNENEDDELVEDDVTDLKALAEELRRNFVVLESKVQSIVEEKEGRNLPLENKRISKKEIIEIETYRFLNKYGYDISYDDKEEPKYQDTMANEIARIIEYINSSNIL